MQRISTFVKAGIIHNEALPLPLRQSALPFVVASLPVLASSVLGAYMVMPLVVALSAFLLYTMARSADSFLFTLSKQHARLAVTFPLCSFIAVWVILLTLIGRGAMVNGIVGPYCILLLVACAPAYRWRAGRTTRRIPLWLSFSVAGAVAVSAASKYVL